MISKILLESFHLPWTEDNNPNGWIEPTTFCQLACAGCYRDCNREGSVAQHVPLPELKKQVDWFIAKRNVQTISLAGGEPLMYPQLDELVSYIHSAGCRIMIYTNGLQITPSRLKELEAAGATQIMVHIDEFQNRPDINSNAEIEKLRLSFCEMFRVNTKVKLGFIQPISGATLQSVQSILHVAAKNIDVVSLIVFTIYRDICKDQTDPSLPADIGVKEMLTEIQKCSPFKPAAYLRSSKNKEDISWLFGIRVGTVHNLFAAFSSNLYKLFHTQYYKKHKRHLFISRNNKISVKLLFGLFRFKEVRTILKNYFTAKQKAELYFQTILILRGIEERNNIWDECEACPDRMIYKGKLVPSCILEELKKKDVSRYKNVEL